jgi:hypothetical protein
MSQALARKLLIVLIGSMMLAIAALLAITLFWPIGQGPSIVRTHGDVAWVLSDRQLHRFDSGGARRDKASLESMGLSDFVADFQVVDADTFLIADQTAFFRCTFGRGACEPIPLAGVSQRRDVRRLTLHEDGVRLAVSDASAHTISVFERDGGPTAFKLKQRVTEGLRFPGQMRWDGDSLWVANTNAHQLTRIDPFNAAAKMSAFPLKHANLRTGREWPFAMTRTPDGRWWMLLAGNAMQHADVLVLDATATPTKVVPLALPSQDPSSIAALGERILIADAESFRLWQAQARSFAVENFGDVGFQAELNSALRSRDIHRTLPNWLKGYLLVAVALGMLLGRQAGELDKMKAKPWAVSDAQSALSETQVAQVSPGALTRVHALPDVTLALRLWVVVFGVISTIALGALLYAAWPEIYGRDCGVNRACDPLGLVRGGAIGVLVLMALAYVLHWQKLRSLESIEIATDGMQLFVTQAGKTRVCDADRASLTPSQLLMASGQAVPLRINGAPLFDEALLQREIFSRLPKLWRSQS